MHQKNIIIALVITLAFTTLVNTTTVSISGRKLLVDGKQFIAKGVDYGVTPHGQWLDSFNGKSWDWQSSPSVYQRDLPLMKEMGINSIRTYKWRNNVNHTDFLDECYKNGIYVIVGWQWSWDKFATSTGKQSMRDDLVTMIKNHASHPAILMWAVGNELNLNRGYDSAVWDFIKELVALVHTTEKTMNT